MSDLPIERFREAIQSTYGARSTYRWSESIRETSEDGSVWTAEVHVFELLDHPRAFWCYCWDVDGTVTAVIEAPPVYSARTAVRASIEAAAAPPAR